MQYRRTLASVVVGLLSAASACQSPAPPQPEPCLSLSKPGVTRQLLQEVKVGATQIEVEGRNGESEPPLKANNHAILIALDSPLDADLGMFDIVKVQKVERVDDHWRVTTSEKIKHRYAEKTTSLIQFREVDGDCRVEGELASVAKGEVMAIWVHGTLVLEADGNEDARISSDRSGRFGGQGGTVSGDSNGFQGASRSGAPGTRDFTENGGGGGGGQTRACLDGHYGRGGGGGGHRTAGVSGSLGVCGKGMNEEEVQDAKGGSPIDILRRLRLGPGGGGGGGASPNANDGGFAGGDGGAGGGITVVFADRIAVHKGRAWISANGGPGRPGNGQDKQIGGQGGSGSGGTVLVWSCKPIPENLILEAVGGSNREQLGAMGGSGGDGFVYQVVSDQPPLTCDELPGSHQHAEVHESE